MARLFRRGSIWYAWIPRNDGTGGTRKISTNCTNKDAAAKRAAELEREAVDPEGAAQATATLADALELLIRARASDAKAGKRSGETVDFYRKKSGVLVDALATVLKRDPEAPIFLRELTPGVLDDYVHQRRDDGAQDSTIGKELTTWRAAMRIAKRRRLWRGDIDELFPRGFSGASKPRERWVTPDELLKLYAALVRPPARRTHGLSDEQLVDLRARFDAGEPRAALARAFKISTSTLWKVGHRHDLAERQDDAAATAHGNALFAIVAFSIATSAEWSAIWRARREDIAPDLSSVIVRGSKNSRRKERPVAVQLPAFVWLLGFARAHGDGINALFSDRSSSFRTRLREACKRAGIAPLSPNDLRRTHAKWLRLAGVTPANIAPNMGHADARMVERRYGQASAAEVAHVQAAEMRLVLEGGGKPTEGGELATARLLLGQAGETPEGEAGQGGPTEGGAPPAPPASPAAAAPAETGLLMGCALADSGDLGPPAAISDPEVSAEICGAQERNRTADTGIFNPPRARSNVGGNADSAHVWDANGPASGSSWDSGSGVAAPAETAGEVEPPSSRKADPSPASDPRPGLARARDHHALDELVALDLLEDGAPSSTGTGGRS